MKFKEFITNEKFIRGRKEWMLMANLSMPLTPSILKEFETDIDTAYHITDLKGFQNLLKLQGKQKDIACFTKGSNGIAKGAKTNGSILAKVSGKTSFHSAVDFMSVLDRNGLRWIDGKRRDDNLISDFKRKMEKEIMETFDLINIKVLQENIEGLDSKQKARFIGWYYDKSKKIIDKKMINSVMEFLKKEAISKSGEYTNDEVFIHQLKIEEVKIVNKYDSNYPEKEYEDEVEFLKKKNFNINFIDRDYVRKIQ